MFSPMSLLGKVSRKGRRAPIVNRLKRPPLYVEQLEGREMLSVTAGPVSFSGPHDQTLHINASALLANASSASDNPLPIVLLGAPGAPGAPIVSMSSGGTLSAVLVGGPSDGSFTLNSDGSADYTPIPGFVGSDSVLLEAFDGTDYSAPFTATINVTDNAPQVVVGNFGLLKGQDFTGTFASFTDADNPNGTFTAAIDFGDGQTGTGTVTADPQGGYDVYANHVYATAGIYDYSVTITDPLGVSSGATAAVSVMSQYDYTYTDPDGNQTQFIYTGNWQVTQEIGPLGNSTSYSYTSLGQLASQTDALGRQIDLSYDSAGDLTGELWLNADGSTQDTQTFTYDSAGDLLTASNENGSYTFSYSNGQLVGVTEPFGVSMTLGYDSAGNRNSVADSFGGLTSSVYDSNNELLSRSFTDGTNSLDIGLGYNADGTIASINRYSDVAGTQLVASTAYAYSNGQLGSITHTDTAGNVIDAFNYSFDSNGLVTSQTSQSGGTSNYTYDSTGQLTEDGTNTYSYDANGNRTMSGYVTGPDNQLLSDGTWNYSYDAIGNTVGKSNIATGETWTYTYDNMNHMTQASQYAADGTLLMQAAYKYDAFGNRIEKDVWTPAQGAAVTRFALDGFNNDKPTPDGNENWDVWAELDGNNSLVTRYVNGDSDNQVFARIDGNGVAWLLTDNLGSVRDVVSNAGVLLDQISYDAYGNITHELNPGYGGQVLYTSNYLDAESGLYFSRARYFDTFTGRWTTQDPLGFSAGDSDLYRYVDNSPTNFSDPSGLRIIYVTQSEYNALTPQQEANAQRSGDEYRVIGAPNPTPAPPPPPPIIAPRPGTREYNDAFQIGSTPEYRAIEQENRNAMSGVFTAMSLVPGAQVFAVVPLTIDLADGNPIGAAVGLATLGAGPILRGVRSGGAASATATQGTLTAAAGRARATVGAGRGPVYGTRVHSAFETEVNALGSANLSTEVSYLNGQVVPRGTAGSVRLDVVQGPLNAPTAIFDLKTGGASLTPARIQQIQRNIPGGANVPVIEIR